MVRDYRDGLGMPLRAKKVAISSVVLFGTLSAVMISSRLWMSALVVALCVCGILSIVYLVPLRERVLEQRAAELEQVLIVGVSVSEGTVVLGADNPGGGLEFGERADRRVENLDEHVEGAPGVGGLGAE